MHADFLLEVFRHNAECDALIWREEVVTYGWLLAETEGWRARLRDERIPRGAVVSFESDFSPQVVALLLAFSTQPKHQNENGIWAKSRTVIQP